MKNALGRQIPSGFEPFVSPDAYKSKSRVLVKEREPRPGYETVSGISALFDAAEIRSGATLSFHHHLRNGDLVLNAVAEEIKRRNLTDIRLAPSSLFPVNAPVAELIENGNVTDLCTDYLNGPVADAVSSGRLRGKCLLLTHGGRPRAIESGDLHIDVAILAVPAVDKNGNGSGFYGRSACGSLGYAVADLEYADRVAFVTDNLVDGVLEDAQLDGRYADFVVRTDRIGDPAGIVSGTTKITRDPVGLTIAANAAALLDEIGLIENGLSMQTGAGGTSLAVASYVRRLMLEKGIRGSFASGGITEYFTDMLEDGLLDRLYDVQCFDLKAVESIRKNTSHKAISASEYANPYDDNIVDRLDFAILGATEADLDFNVNVTTDSHGRIMGGSGGHSDVARGANVTVIVTGLVKSRLPIMRERVTTVTTPGEDVDVIVTERGIAVNPRRKDLLERLENSTLPICTAAELLEKAHAITGKPAPADITDMPVAVEIYADGTAIDTIYKTAE